MALSKAFRVVIEGDASKATSAFSKAEGASAGFADKLTSAGRKLSVGLTLPLVAAGAAAVKFGSDLAEEIDKVNVVFGESAGKLQEWSKTTAAAFGVSRREALGAAGAFGNMFTTIGLATPAAANMSQKMVELAADMASFSNQDPSAMLDRLRSGLAGEAEPLRQFGVLISEAKVQAEAMRLGLADARGELSEGAKVQARYSLILKETVVQQGNAALTAATVAGQTRRAKAAAEDAAGSFGTALLPITQKLIGFVGGLAEKFGSLSPQMQNALLIAGGAAAAAGPLLSFFGHAIKGAQGLASAFTLARSTVQGLSFAFPGLMAGLGLVGGAAALAGVAMGLNAKMNADNERSLRGLAQAYVDGKIPQDEWLRIVAAGSLVSNDFRGRLSELVGELRDQVPSAARTAIVETEQFEKAMDEAREAAATFAGMTQQEFDAWEDKTEAAMNGVRDVLAKLAEDSNLTAAEVIKAFHEQLVTMATYEKNWDTLVARGLPDSLAQQIQEMGLKGAGLVKALADANDKEFARIIRDWKKAEDQAGDVAGAIGRMRDALEGLQKIASALQGVIGLPLPKFVPTPGRAHGGPVTAGHPFLVGERGPELFVPRGSGAIIPNGRSGGSVTFNNTFHITEARNAQDTARAVRDELLRMKRRTIDLGLT